MVECMAAEIDAHFRELGLGPEAVQAILDYSNHRASKLEKVLAECRVTYNSWRSGLISAQESMILIEATLYRLKRADHG